MTVTKGINLIKKLPQSMLNILHENMYPAATPQDINYVRLINLKQLL